MPFVQITMLEGRTVEQKHDLIRKLTDATAEALGGDPGRIRVVIYEVSADSWGIGGDPVSQRPQLVNQLAQIPGELNNNGSYA